MCERAKILLMLMTAWHAVVLGPGEKYDFPRLTEDRVGRGKTECEQEPGDEWREVVAEEARNSRRRRHGKGGKRYGRRKAGGANEERGS